MHGLPEARRSIFSPLLFTLLANRWALPANARVSRIFSLQDRVRVPRFSSLRRLALPSSSLCRIPPSSDVYVVAEERGHVFCIRAAGSPKSAACPLREAAPHKH
ncbi:hypothetical protein C8R44DRAFT_886427 [Mycena epipterygia]|nr:hypothetical protein C8R44DRAFT_886427 [Mycena epipterygia]